MFDALRVGRRGWLKLLGGMLGVAGATAANGASNVCALVTLDEVSFAIGAPAAGGRLVSTDPATGMRSCPYSAGVLTIVVAVRPFESSDKARDAFTADLHNLQAHEGEAQRTTVEKGVGGGAYWVATNAGLDSIGWTALHGRELVMIAVVGQGAIAVPRERLRGLMQKALSR